MKLDDVINSKWLDAKLLKKQYKEAKPFPHIVMENFIKEDVLDAVMNEFPDLSKDKTAVVQFNHSREKKFGGIGMQILSPAALHLSSYLQSDLFLEWLNEVGGIEEHLISDPYLTGGGYHEIKSGGLLKVHADFNKHPKLDLDRRMNLLVYLNKDWNEDWGGALQLFNRSMDKPVQTIPPRFNTAVLFSTTSFTYHGHPDALKCPDERSRKSLAYYYFSTGRPQAETSEEGHGTLFKERTGEKFVAPSLTIKDVLRDIVPPILVRGLKRLLR